MKPGNRLHSSQVPIPTRFYILEDEDYFRETHLSDGFFYAINTVLSFAKINHSCT